MWILQLRNIAGEVIAVEWSNKEIITTKDIGELNWELSDGDKLELEYREEN